MSRHPMPECERFQTNGYRSVSRPGWFAVLMLCALLLVPAFVQPALAGPPDCPEHDLFTVSTPASPGEPVNLASLNPLSGHLTHISGLNPVGDFFNVSAMAFHPVTKVLYAVGNRNDFDTNPVALLTIDPCTGATTWVADLTGSFDSIEDMTFHPTGLGLYVYVSRVVNGSYVGSLNLTTGAVTDPSPVLIHPASPVGHGLAWSPVALGTPKLYNAWNGGLRSEVPGVGGTFLGAFSWPYFCDGSNCPRPLAMDFQPLTNTLFATVISDTGHSLATIDTTTRVVTNVGLISSDQVKFEALAFYPNNGDTDGDGVLDSEDNCPTGINPPTTWTDYLGLLHVNSQPDFDLDGVGDACDNCKKVVNVDQANADGDLLGDACDAGVSENHTSPAPAPPGAPKWATATFTNTTGAPIITVQPVCENTLFTLNPAGSPADILPPRYHHRAFRIPDDVVTIATGASFTVSCDLNELFDPSVLVAGTYDVKATYSNDIDPNHNLFVGAVQSTPGTLTVTGDPPVTQTEASVVYAPSAWSAAWANGNSPFIVADINLVTGDACTGIATGQPIMMNGFAAGTYSGGVSGAPAHAIASFVGSQAVLSLGTTIPGTYSSTVQGSCLNPPGALFTAQAQITLGKNVSIDIRPLSGANKINSCSRLPVPVAIFSDATFDATKIVPASVTLAGGTVGSIKGHLLSTTLLDLNRDGKKDMLALIDTRTMTLNPSMTSAILEGIYVKTLGDGTKQNVPIYGQDTVRIMTRCSDGE